MRPARDLSRAVPGVALPAGAGGAVLRKATLLLVGSLTVMSGATIAPSLPAIEAHFASVPDAAFLTRLVLTMPALLIIVAAPLAGWLADRFGRIRLLVGAALIYGIAGVSGLVLETILGIIAGRALLGVAVAGVMTTATALVGDYFQGAERGRFMGQQAAFHGLAGLAFLTGGGFLAEAHWRAPFALYGIAFLIVPAVLAWLDEPPRGTAQRPSGPGVALAAGRATGTGAAIALVYAAAFLVFLAMYLIPTQLPFHLQGLGAGSPGQAGIAIGIGSVTMVPAALYYGRIRDRLGTGGVFALGFALMAAALLVIGAAGSYRTVVAAMLLSGLGLGVLIPNLTTTAVAMAPPAARGRVSGGLMASIFLGQFLSPLASQPWIGWFGVTAPFRDMGLLLTLIAVATAGVAVLRRRVP